MAVRMSQTLIRLVHPMMVRGGIASSDEYGRCAKDDLKDQGLHDVV